MADAAKLKAPMLCRLGLHRGMRKKRRVSQSIAEFECERCGRRMMRRAETEEQDPRG